MLKTIELTKLKREVDLLKSAIFGFIGRDAEGEYRPAFVRKTLRRANERSVHEFKTARDFMKALHEE